MFNVHELAERVNKLSYNSAKDLVEIGLAFFEAKEHLKESDYASFLKMTHYDQKSSMIRKWYGIGKSYQRLRSIENRLPPVATTIYLLATLNIDDFNRLTQSEILKVSTTTKEINEFLNPKQSTKGKPRLIIEFLTSTNEFQLKELHDLVESMYSSYVEIKMNEEFKSLLDAATSKSHLTLKAA